MANNYSQATMGGTIPCNRDEYLGLIRALDKGQDNEDYEPHGFTAVPFHNPDYRYFYMCSGESCNVDALPKPFLKLLGRLLARNKMRYVSIGVAYTCDKPRPGEFGGYECRITSKGKLVWPTVTWPKEAI